MRIRWTPAAAADLEQIKDYLTERMPEHTESTILRLYASIRSLKAMPSRGRNAMIVEDPFIIDSTRYDCDYGDRNLGPGSLLRYVRLECWNMVCLEEAGP
jgi:plasmid stabilization system protein ParE